MKRTLAILAILFIGTLTGCSADDATKTTETSVSKKMSEEPEAYIDNIDYKLIENKYPDTNLLVLQENLYQISLGNVSSVCNKSFISTPLYGGYSTWKADVSVFDVGLGFCIQRNRHFLWSKIGDEFPGYWDYAYTNYTISVNCQCENPR